MRPFAALVLLAALAVPSIGEVEGASVEIQALAGTFSPGKVEARAGDLVMFHNADGRAHTVTSAWDGGASFHRVLQPGESFVVRFDAEGEYAIRCVPHSVEDGRGGHEGMVAQVRVVVPAATVEEASPGFHGTLALVPLALALLGILTFWLRGAAAGLPRARPTQRP